MTQKTLLALAFVFAFATSTFAQKTLVQTSDGIFTTRENPSALPLPKDDDAFQFIIYGDRTGGDRAGLKVLRQAVNDTNLMDPDLVLTVGDLIQGYNRPLVWQQEADEFREIMRGLTMPWFPVAGNHDIYWDGKDPERPRFHHEKNYEANFGPLWYSFQHKNTGFIMLYSDEGDLETGEKGFNQGRMQNMSLDQIAFLKQALQKYKDLPQVFVALHHPRWTGGGYAGSNWPQIHQMLVGAGNVPAVFAGHIHRMRYDPQDGIDYYALATTGGSLSADLPEVGFLHHFNVVTVRPDGYSMATIPVGAVMDPRKFAPEYLTDVHRVQNMRPQRSADKLGLTLDGTVADHYSIAVPNPGMHPLEVAVTPQVSANWRVVPDHQHIVIPPGKTDGMEFYFYRNTGSIASDNNEPWSGFQNPGLEMAVDYLHESARIRLPVVTVPVDVELANVPAAEFENDLQNCLVLNGKVNKITDCARVNSSDLSLPQGPFTLEAWVNPAVNDGNRGVVAKTETSEFAIFLADGVPLMDVHLDGQYVTAKAAGKLPTNKWTHLAGVYDGRQVRLFVDGKLAASREGSGKRTINDLPLYIGADPGGKGNPVRPFVGKLDEIRLSKSVRYVDAFTPSRRFKTDENTIVLLHMDRSAGPFLLDDSRPATAVMRMGNATIQPLLD